MGRGSSRAGESPDCVIDLSADDEVPHGSVGISGGGGPRGGEGTGRGGGEGKGICAGLQGGLDGARKAWFAVSALTGRMHAFGDGEAPVEEGLGANAPLLSVVEDEAELLPARLASPAMLAAARAWAREWLALTPAQRALLHNRPLRTPLLRQADNAMGAGRGKSSVGKAGGHEKASDIGVGRERRAAGGQAITAAPPVRSSGVSDHISTVPETSGLASPHTNQPPATSSAPHRDSGELARGSTVRQTNAARYAEQRVPDAPHVTRTWVTMNTQVQHTWTQ